MPATAERTANAPDLSRERAARVVLRKSTVQLADPVDVPAGQTTGPRKFESVPYSGEPFDYWFGQCVIDLATLKMPEAGTVTPLLYDHGWTADNPRIGKVLSFANDGQRLTATGEMLNNDSAKRIVADADEGFPFQQSLGIDIGRFEIVEAGNSIVVNGRTLHGPCEVWRDCTINELSFVVLGADSHTEAAILSRMKNHPGGPMPTAAELTNKSGTTTPTQTPQGTAKLSDDADATVKVSEITAEWIKEHKPEIAAEMAESEEETTETTEEMADGADGVPAEEKKTEDLAKPASIAELRKVAADAKLSDADGFVLSMVEAGSTAANAKLAATMISAQLRKAELGREADGAKPVTDTPAAGGGSGGLDGIELGKNRDSDFEKHPAIKDACAKLGRTEGWWKNFAQASLSRGDNPVDFLKKKLEAADAA